MKVAIISPHSLRAWGGGEKWIFSVGNLLSQNGTEVEVYCLDYSQGNQFRVNEKFIRGNSLFEYKEIKHSKGSLKPLGMTSLPRLDADVIYTNGGYFKFLKQILDVDIPTIFGFHDPALYNPSNLLQKRIVNTLFPRFDLIHLLSANRQSMVRGKTKYYILPNTWFREIPQPMVKFSRFTVLFAGRHEVSKGIETLKFVIERLPRDIDLIIAGSGMSSESVISEKENIKVVGFVDEDTLTSLMARSHVLLFPSHSEVSSLTSIESLALTTPVIFRNIPNNEQLIGKPLCMRAVNNDDFLSCILELKLIYERDKDNYLQECRRLPYLLKPAKSYIDEFVRNILSAAIS